MIIYLFSLFIYFFNFCELEKCHVEEIKFFNKKHLNNSYNNFIREAKAFLNLLNDNINN